MGLAGPGAGYGIDAGAEGATGLTGAGTTGALGALSLGGATAQGGPSGAMAMAAQPLLAALGAVPSLATLMAAPFGSFVLAPLLEWAMGARDPLTKTQRGVGETFLDRASAIVPPQPGQMPASAVDTRAPAGFIYDPETGTVRPGGQVLNPFLSPDVLGGATTGTHPIPAWPTQQPREDILARWGALGIPPPPELFDWSTPPPPRGEWPTRAPFTMAEPFGAYTPPGFADPSGGGTIPTWNPETGEWYYRDNPPSVPPPGPEQLEAIQMMLSPWQW